MTDGARFPAESYRDLYRRALLEDVVPFWTRHSPDRAFGGYLTCLDREGKPYGTDKGLWMQSRQVWMLAKLYNEVSPEDAWLDLARLGADFVRAHGYDVDGRMYFAVTRDGRPLRKRRYVFSEAFASIAFAEYARAAAGGSLDGAVPDASDALALARGSFDTLVRHLRTPGLIEPKVDPRTRPMKSLAAPMIVLATTQELRGVDSDPRYTEAAEAAVDEMRAHFLHRERRALLETVAPDGSTIDEPVGRTLNPGHAVEAAWFLLREAREFGRPDVVDDALDVLDWSLERGWDAEYGGLFSFVDLDGRPPERLEWDMKMWWPHTEALVATLMAFAVTGRRSYAEWFERLHAYTFAHFPDPEHGEWFGYLHRDGSVANPLKGSLWKGMFHVPRALWVCGKVLEEVER